VRIKSFGSAFIERGGEEGDDRATMAFNGHGAADLVCNQGRSLD
jgi:hypothetical protein